MNVNPYHSPEVPSQIEAELQPAIEPGSDIGFGCAMFLLFPTLGATIGFAGYLVISAIIESSVMPNVEPPRNTYGQQAGLISLPLSTIIGMTAGVSFAFLVNGWKRISIVGMFLISLLGSLTALGMWYDDGLGECNSALILHVPIIVFCGVIAAFGLLLAAIFKMKGHGESV